LCGRAFHPIKPAAQPEHAEVEAPDSVVDRCCPGLRYRANASWHDVHRAVRAAREPLLTRIEELVYVLRQARHFILADDNASYIISCIDAVLSGAPSVKTARESELVEHLEAAALSGSSSSVEQRIADAKAEGYREGLAAGSEVGAAAAVLAHEHGKAEGRKEALAECGTCGECAGTGTGVMGQVIADAAAEGFSRGFDNGFKAGKVDGARECDAVLDHEESLLPRKDDRTIYADGEASMVERVRKTLEFVRGGGRLRPRGDK
jgi:hypothetical protein